MELILSSTESAEFATIRHVEIVKSFMVKSWFKTKGYYHIHLSSPVFFGGEVTKLINKKSSSDFIICSRYKGEILFSNFNKDISVNVYLPSNNDFLNLDFKSLVLVGIAELSCEVEQSQN